MPVQVQGACGIARMVRTPDRKRAKKSEFTPLPTVPLCHLMTERCCFAVIAFLKPHSKMIFERFFSLIDELGSMEVIHVLTRMIEVIGVDIAPIALEMTQKLVLFINTATMRCVPIECSALSCGLVLFESD